MSLMKRLLVLNFFPAFFPPKSGGEQRYYYLYAALSRFYDITLLSPTHAEADPELVRFSDCFREYRVPKEPVHADLHARLHKRGITGECSALVCALASARAGAYHERCRALGRDADLIVHESPYMLNYDECLGSDSKPRIYNSYNVEAALAESMFPGPRGQPFVSFIADLERALVEQASLVFATSDVEVEAFCRRYDVSDRKLALAPNGVEPGQLGGANPSRATARQRLGLDPEVPLALFIGSAHPPNLEAVRFLCEVVAPAAPGVHFLVAGAAGERLKQVAANVHPLGSVTAGARADSFAACDLALNPMFSGAGTNLKMLDYFAAGLPVVTTAFGCRGLPVESGRHCLVAEANDFARAVAALAMDAGRRESIGACARELAYAQFSWSSIAASMRPHIDALLGIRRAPRCAAVRRRILLLNDYPVSHPTAGGQIRINHLFAQVARSCDVDLLCLTDEMRFGQTEISDGFTEYRVPKTPETRTLEDSFSTHWVAAHDVIASWTCAANAELAQWYRRLVARADAIALQHPYLVRLLGDGAPPVPVIYEAHNAEAALKAELLREHPERERLLAEVEFAERRACELAACVVCMSEENLRDFARVVGMRRVRLIPNGVDAFRESDPAAVGRVRSAARDAILAVFVGSGHPPNVEAAQFIIDRLATANPCAHFLLVGGVSEAFSPPAVPPNVHLCGVLPANEKDLLLQVADIALNPMCRGGGSNLKLGDYFAAGLPALSTPVGARGYDLEHGKNIWLAELEEFPEAFARLSSDAELRRRVGALGCRYARERLDWGVLAHDYLRVVDHVTGSGALRVLVATFRFTDPPRGGAEAYLFNTLKCLPQDGRIEVDVATFDVAEIANHLHFSAVYDGAGHATPAFVRRVIGFTPDAVDDGEARDGARRLFRVWQEEDLAQARRLAPRFSDVVLLGGWFHPEQQAAEVRRWTGGAAEICCPPGVSGLRIRGTTLGPTRLRTFFNGQRIRSALLVRAFEVNVSLPDTNGGIVRLECRAAYRSEQDPRMLGVCVHGIDALEGQRERSVPLEQDFTTVMRRQAPSAWVASLVEITEQRASEDDEVFLRIRGPRSSAFERWLAAHVQDYDVVLAHGTPFSPLALTARAAAGAGVPCVLLPHYHMDDKYYHWKHYYEAFRSAALVLSAPDGAKPLFFDRLGAPTMAVPGGALDPEEFLNLELAVQQFRRVHAQARPFVLVLGRKAGAKRYDRVLNAVAAVNAAAPHGCDVVMIGPEEDGRRIDDPNVFYYGAQPRPVVLGALAECLCLATMSESESFGIVLLEAWMCGKPVVANADCLAFAELVANGEDGILCRSDADLVAALRQLLDNPERARALGQRGREKAAERYSWQHVAQIIGAALRRIGARSPSADGAVVVEMGEERTAEVACT